jgi:hypothetical protein
MADSNFSIIEKELQYGAVGRINITWPRTVTSCRADYNSCTLGATTMQIRHRPIAFFQTLLTPWP